jgi:hypothetical protein
MVKMGIGTFAAAVMSSALAVAVPAHADSASDFLTLVSGQGFNVGDTPADVQLTLSMGVEVCHLIHEGYTPQVAGRQVPYMFPNATPQQIAGFVNAAQTSKLCARQFGPLQPGGDY